MLLVDMGSLSILFKVQLGVSQVHALVKEETNSDLVLYLTTKQPWMHHANLDVMVIK